MAKKWKELPVNQKRAIKHNRVLRMHPLELKAELERNEPDDDDWLDENDPMLDGLLDDEECPEFEDMSGDYDPD